ncbi:zinc/manganese/iron ABC transporter, periplasmic zinc/manganese/iron-binding protein [Rhodopirellula maiorica SM1]|uniref:Zinc/manganese/iron ABC transporter, periplasmic zinc/manganese/iron-binding protein n=1 Tax=Rhodopirellula maiorica SM1 TaxID=1265738 RepID=M5RLF7_9BACT|nr:zinc ABC transporter substrate-binding protein [Rhodopirellula maiorica]EMI20036.1 zinc/manganese/iron ABC transporter, periplasmic zinc/manganese/iron-binding protein [Rhodopirellula maiorica SM1]
MKRFLSLALLLFAATFGCDSSSDTSSPTDVNRATKTVDPDSPIAVTATVGMVADLVRTVGGDRVNVSQICGSGVDPHLYKATRDDVVTMMEADMIFYSGLMLEGKMTDTLIKMAREKPVVAVTEAIDQTALLEPDDFAGHYDPHVWMDVSAWAKCVTVIADELSAIDPPSAAAYRERAEKLREQLAELDAYGKRVIATIPKDSRILVTSHDAFNYFGRAYDLEVIGVQGISTESEAGLQQINELVDLLVNKKVKSVFVESSVPRKSIDSLVEGAQSRGHEVSVGEKELFSDAMGATGTYEGTYIGMLDHNMTVVARGLGGEAPEKGFQGKLSP